MDVLIPLLFILLPFIFKLIGKKLEQAGNMDQAEKMRKIAKALGGNEDEEESNAPKFFMEDNEEAEHEDDVEYDDDGNITEVFPKPVVAPPPPKPVTYYMPTDRVAPFFTMTENVERQNAPKPVQAQKPKAKPVLLEEETNERREKIDPKKLVVYSEIMKPKFTE